MFLDTQYLSGLELIKMKHKKQILEEIILKEKVTGKPEPMYPVVVIYYTGIHLNKLNEVRDYLWFNDLPDRYKGYTSNDLYKIKC